MLVAGTVRLAGREVDLAEAPAPRVNRNYECANAKLSTTLGFIPRHSVLDSATDLVERLEDAHVSELTDPRHYNIRWLELLSEQNPILNRFQTIL
jgi:hypothetical protein